jgi:hypothetical protein
VSKKNGEEFATRNINFDKLHKYNLRLNESLDFDGKEEMSVSDSYLRTRMIESFCGDLGTLRLDLASDSMTR